MFYLIGVIRMIVKSCCGKVAVCRLLGLGIIAAFQCCSAELCSVMHCRTLSAFVRHCMTFVLHLITSVYILNQLTSMDVSWMSADVTHPWAADRSQASPEGFS